MDDMETHQGRGGRSLVKQVDVRGYRRAIAGTRRARRADGGEPTRLPSGEWMLRIAVDLPEAMLDALEERAGGDRARMGELVRAALVAAGIGGDAHVPGIRDGSYAESGMDDDAAIAAEMAQLRLAVAHVQGPPKGGSTMCNAGLRNSRSGRDASGIKEGV